MHPARRAQLAHSGIDDWIPGSSGSPCVELRMRPRELKTPHLLLQRRILERFVEIRQLQEEIALRHRAQVQRERDPLFSEQELVLAPVTHPRNDAARSNQSERKRGAYVRRRSFSGNVSSDSIMKDLAVKISRKGATHGVWIRIRIR